MKEYGTVFYIGGQMHLFDREENETLCRRFGGNLSGSDFRYENGVWYQELFTRGHHPCDVPGSWHKPTDVTLKGICKQCKSKAEKPKI